MRAREQQLQQMQHIGGVLPDQKMQQGEKLRDFDFVHTSDAYNISVHRY